LHPLDNPAWHALHGPHASFAETNDLAARYHPAVAPFAALPDEPTPEAWDALRSLVGPGRVAVLFRDVVHLPDGWAELFRMPTLQMVGAGVEGVRSPHLETLGTSDAPAMLTLVEHTAPGPFSARTHELGTFLGVREGGSLVAMAGERMQPPGHVEISAVCTEPTHRGRGLASTLMKDLMARIRDRGEVPFLHVVVENVTAIRVYDALGFTRRRLVEVVGVRTPE
jgi:ribosomal protein S18 acetylase RimI-like enzyme